MPSAGRKSTRELCTDKAAEKKNMIEAIRIGTCQKRPKQLSLQEASGNLRGEGKFSDEKGSQNLAGLLSYTQKNLVTSRTFWNGENIMANTVVVMWLM